MAKPLSLFCLAALFLSGCAASSDAPPPFRGDAVVLVGGERTCGLHHIPLRRRVVYFVDADAGLRPTPAYSRFAPAFPNHTKYIYQDHPAPGWDHPTTVEHCPECDRALTALLTPPTPTPGAAKKSGATPTAP